MVGILVVGVLVGSGRGDDVGFVGDLVVGDAVDGFCVGNFDGKCVGLVGTVTVTGGFN